MHPKSRPVETFVVLVELRSPHSQSYLHFYSLCCGNNAADSTHSTHCVSAIVPICLLYLYLYLYLWLWWQSQRCWFLLVVALALARVARPSVPVPPEPPSCCCCCDDGVVVDCDGRLVDTTTAKSTRRELSLSCRADLPHSQSQPTRNDATRHTIPCPVRNCCRSFATCLPKKNNTVATIQIDCVCGCDSPQRTTATTIATPRHVPMARLMYYTRTRMLMCATNATAVAVIVIVGETSSWKPRVDVCEGDDDCCCCCDCDCDSATRVANDARLRVRSAVEAAVVGIRRGCCCT